MATVSSAQQIRCLPTTHPLPNSLREQQAIFWSGIILTTLTLFQILASFLGYIHMERTQRFLILIGTLLEYGVYFDLRRRWRTPMDEINIEPLLTIPLSNLDSQVYSSRSGMLRFAGWGSILLILIATLRAVLNGQFSSIPLPMLAFLPILSIPLGWSQPSRISILPTGLLWKVPTSTTFFPWESLESTRLIPGEAIDRLQWTAPKGWEKSYRYETKLEKMTDADRETLKRLLSQYTSVKAD